MLIDARQEVIAIIEALARREDFWGTLIRCRKSFGRKVEAQGYLPGLHALYRRRTDERLLADFEYYCDVPEGFNEPDKAFNDVRRQIIVAELEHRDLEPVSVFSILSCDAGGQ